MQADHLKQEFMSAYKKWELANREELPYTFRENLWEKYWRARDAYLFGPKKEDLN